MKIVFVFASNSFERCYLHLMNARLLTETERKTVVFLVKLAMKNRKQHKQARIDGRTKEGTICTYDSGFHLGVYCGYLNAARHIVFEADLAPAPRTWEDHAQCALSTTNKSRLYDVKDEDWGDDDKSVPAVSLYQQGKGFCRSVASFNSLAELIKWASANNISVRY